MDINKLFEQVLVIDEYVEQHNFLVAKLAPELVEELTITNTDTLDEAKKKRKKAKKQIKRYGFFYPLYPRVIKTGEQPKEEPTTPPTEPTDSGDSGTGDTGGDAGGDAGGDGGGVGEAERIPRKPGQPAGSKKHSDLYTDENPKGTIHGLKFATVEDAEKSVSKIRNSGRSHAHKIQAAIAMEQRAKVAGKISAAAVYRSFINSMKKKTDEIKPQNVDNAFAFPYSLGPEQDDEFIQKEALSSTERMRRYNRRHPEKVRKYLKKTQDDRVARNRDRKKAVKKYGKSKMKNHDVHHPNGAKNGNWKLAKKDHGRDKKNENIEYVYLSELLEGNVPNGSWQLINEGGAAGHLAHPYEDDNLTFKDMKEMAKRGLVGGLDAEAPVTEKLDGQNITFSVRDGRVVFARNKGQVKNRGKNALDVAGIRGMFRGHPNPNIETAFNQTAEDVQAAIDALPEEQRQQMFGEGSKFMNVEIIFPDTKNVIPYGKPVLVFHGTIEYDEDGEEVGRNVEDAKLLDQQLQAVSAQKQRTFGLSGPQPITFNDADTVRNKERLQKYGAEMARIQEEFDLDDNSTLEEYKTAWWSREIDNMGVDWTPEEREGLIRRWVMGEKKFGVKDIQDPEKKKFFREYEANELKQAQKKATRPIERIFLRIGADTLLRVTNTLGANNPEMASQLKQEVKDAIQKIKETGDENQLAMLQREIERLEDIGIDSVVPSEGLVFIYNGKPYKFTGAFAPVNQMLGMMKFARGKAKEVEEPKEKPAEKAVEKPQVSPTGEKRRVAIFPGRFQPFHAGHYSIYKKLVNEFGEDNVYIVSSDVTDPTRSPFGFDEKKQIMMQMFGIPDDKVVQVKSPYAPKELTANLPPDTTTVYAMSEKDSDRLKGGKYFQPYDPATSSGGYGEQGYVMIAPEMQLQLDGRNISGTQVRALLGNPKITDEMKKEIFTKIYGKFDPEIFKKIIKTTTDSEEALRLTQQHGGDAEPKPSAKKKQVVKKPVSTQTAAEKPPTDPSFYKPGQSWETDTGNFGGKNRKNQVRYFKTRDRADKFAKL